MGILAATMGILAATMGILLCKVESVLKCPKVESF